MWTKLSDDFNDDCANVSLSDAAFRTHVEGLLWANRRLTDGHISRLALRRLADTGQPEKAVQELVDHGFWKTVDGGWQIVHHIDHQIPRAEVERRREADAERQRRSRSKRKSAPVTADVTRDNARDPGRDGTGLVGSGLEEHHLEGEDRLVGARAVDGFDVVGTCAESDCLAPVVRTGPDLMYRSRPVYCELHKKVRL